METKSENKVCFNVLQAISRVFKASKDSKLKNELFKKINPKLELLSGYFKVTKKQAFLLANVYALLCNGRTFELPDLSHHLGVEPVDLLGLQEDLDELNSKGILLKKRNRNGFYGTTNFVYFMEDTISKAILKNSPIQHIKPLTCKDIFEVLNKIYLFSEERNEDKMTTEELFSQMEQILDANSHLGLIQKVKNLELCNDDTYLFYYLCWKTITGNESIDFNNVADVIFDDGYQKARYSQEFYSGKNILMSQKFVTLIEGTFFNDSDIRLSPKSIELLKSENIALFSRKISRDNIISVADIGAKDLFFGSSENRQLEMIENTLKSDNFDQLQQRMKQKHMPAGVALLLYGAPRTGKNKSAYQIARKTGREIMHVDISQAKSMWFGGSEKRIKQIFTDYREFVEQSKLCPILLFNEADAILSRRKDSSYSIVSQTENAMQNIILEEMEKLNGIMFATTNLTANLDSAFERRFLYKVEFFPPDFNARKLIWKSKLIGLSEKDGALLADKFHFSGGQIENIARKCEMFEILNGRIPDINKIVEFCEEELIDKKQHITVGYKINHP